jgi:hypothetical protein
MTVTNYLSRMWNVAVMASVLLRYYPSICLDRLRENNAKCIEGNSPMGPESNPGSPKYEVEVITTRSHHRLAWNGLNCLYHTTSLNYATS